mgnify:CR=1 FL=1
MELWPLGRCCKILLQTTWVNFTKEMLQAMTQEFKINKILTQASKRWELEMNKNYQMNLNGGHEEFSSPEVIKEFKKSVLLLCGNSSSEVKGLLVLKGGTCSVCLFELYWKWLLRWLNAATFSMYAARGLFFSSTWYIKKRKVYGHIHQKNWKII